MGVGVAVSILESRIAVLARLHPDNRGPEGLLIAACENAETFKVAARALLGEYLERKGATEFSV